MKITTFGAAVLVAGSMAAPASAHHSFAMFDTAKTVTIEGTVQEFTWANPHATLWVVVKSNAGTTQDWPIEMTGPAALARMGVTKRSFNAGDHVKVDIHPLRNGSVGGSLVGATFPETGKRVFLDRGASAVPQ